MPFVTKTAALALSTALLLSIAPSALAADVPLIQVSSSSLGSAQATPTSEPSHTVNSTDPTDSVDARISKDHAVELAKQAISLPEGYTLQGIQFSSNSYLNGKAAWSI